MTSLETLSNLFTTLKIRTMQHVPIKLRLVRKQCNEYVVLFPNKIKLVFLNYYYYKQLLEDKKYIFEQNIYD